LTVESALRWAEAHLEQSESPQLDAQLLMGFILDKPRSWVLAHGDHSLSLREKLCFTALIDRRARGEPVAYLRGHVEWFDLDLLVNHDVLIPRPASELLLEAAIRICLRIGAQTLVDLGTGTGAIAIGLARALPESRVIATDVSTRALVVARRNIERYGLQDRVATRHGSLLEPLREEPDFLVANLPYLTDEYMENPHRDVAHEPKLALRGGTDGLELYREFFRQMAERGWLVPSVLEIDPHHDEDMRAFVKDTLPVSNVRILPGSGRLARMVAVERLSSESRLTVR
jgi:release factor glutamine methyltransferase